MLSCLQAPPSTDIHIVFVSTYSFYRVDFFAEVGDSGDAQGCLIAKCYLIH